MKLNIKLTSGLKFTTEFTGSTVQEVKQHLTNEHSCAVPSQQRLVYKGRILDDGKKLKEDYDIVEGSTLFLVAMKETPATATTAAAAAAAAGTNTTATSLARPPMAASTIPAPPATTSTDINRLIQQMTQMQTQPTTSPPASSGSSSNNTTADPLSSLQSLMGDNPEFLANMMQSQMENNPALRRIMSENPMVREALSDPAALRQMMQTMTNQDYRAQQQRHHDLALANIENMPGGFNMLRNLYETVQVPMEEAATAAGASRGGSGGGGGDRASNNGTTGTSVAGAAARDATAGATNQAMPNPWGSSRPSRTNSTTNRNATLSGLGGGTDPFGAGGNPFAASMGLMGALGTGGQHPQQPSREQQEAAIAMLESNPALQQMLSASMRQNPAMLRQMIQQSGSSNPAAAMMNNMSDEQLTSMMEMATNPTAMRQIMRMQDLMQNTPNGGMPNPMEMMALMGGDGMPNPMEMMALMGGRGGINNNNSNNTPPFGGINPAALAPNPWATTTQPPQPPAVRYARQLEQLRNMGFDDETAALAALERANGNLNRAVDLLLDSSSSINDGGAGATGGGDNASTDT